MMIIMVNISKMMINVTVVVPANTQSKEVEYSGYMPGQAVQVISFCYLLNYSTRDG